MNHWSIRTSRHFDRAVRRLDRPVAMRVLDYIEAVVELDDPHSRGKMLTGDLAGMWRYRVGDYRVLVELRDDEFLVLALDVAHRSKIYER